MKLESVHYFQSKDVWGVQINVQGAEVYNKVV